MKYRVTLNDRVYEVEVELAEAMLLSEYQTIAPATVSAAAPVEAPAAAAAPVAAPVVAGAGDAVVAPMPGTILKVNVNNGDSVQEGQVLVRRSLQLRPPWRGWQWMAMCLAALP